MSKRIGILTPSYNKQHVSLDAINSIISQTHQNIIYIIYENSTDNGITRGLIKNFLEVNKEKSNNKVIYREIDFTPEQREAVYIPAYLFNNAWEELKNEHKCDYLFYISDDDVIDTNLLEDCVNYLENNPDKSTCYFKLGLSNANTPTGFTLPVMPDGNVFTIEGPTLDRIDGGQVFYRASVLDKFPTKEYTTSDKTKDIARHCDGFFVVDLVKYGGPIHPINDGHRIRGRHRMFPNSTWRKGT